MNACTPRTLSRIQLPSTAHTYAAATAASAALGRTNGLAVCCLLSTVPRVVFRYWEASLTATALSANWACGGILGREWQRGAVRWALKLALYVSCIKLPVAINIKPNRA